MTQQIINVGSAIADGTGDPARTAFTKSNANFTELYARGSGNVSNSGTPTVGQSAEWVTATTIKGVSAPTPQCGRLTYVGPTVLSFAPMNGDKIKINGVIYTIPTAGIAGLGNTSVRVNNVAGQNLAANTQYHVFAENVSGTITGHFWTVAGGLAAPHHRPSQTAGNEGVEAWYNGTELPQFTLIGLIRTNASAQFADQVDARCVRSWFNRERQICNAVASGSNAATVPTPIGLIAHFMCFAGEAIACVTSGYYTTAGSAQGTAVQVWIDGAAAPNTTLGYSISQAAWTYVVSAIAYQTLAEGYHYSQVAMNSTAAVSVTYTGAIAVTIG